MLTPTESAQGGQGVSVEQFLVCPMRLSSYVLTCQLSSHPRLYKYQRVMLTPTGSAQGGGGLLNTMLRLFALNFCFKSPF